MPPNSTSSDIWLCDSRHAQLKLEGLQASLDVRRPWDGLFDLVVGNAALAQTSLFRINSNPGTELETVADTYTRGRDLVVHYRQTTQRPISLHVYWRGIADDGVCAIDQIVSMQTDQLDSDPTLCVQHLLPPGEFVSFESQGASLLFQPQGCTHSWLLAANPADCEQRDIETDVSSGTLVSFQLFRPGLEKGVIRRAQLRAVLLPRDDDTLAARHGEQAFLKAELPLTT